jgi:hypothetical protein
VEKFAAAFTAPKDDAKASRLQGKMAIAFLQGAHQLRPELIPKLRVETVTETMNRTSIFLRIHISRRLFSFANRHTLNKLELLQFEECGRFLLRLIKNSGMPLTDATAYSSMEMPGWLLKNFEVLRIDDEVDESSQRILGCGSTSSCQGGEHLNHVAQTTIPFCTNMHEGFQAQYTDMRQMENIASQQGVPEFLGADSYRAHSVKRFDPCMLTRAQETQINPAKLPK